MRLLRATMAARPSSDTAMPAPKLVLHPDAANSTPPIETLVGILAELGVIGTPFELDGRVHYRTGPGFLDHLTFLGCAPSIALDPPASDMESAARTGHFCHVQVTVATPEPRVRQRAGRAPRCRYCRCDVTAEMLAQPGQRLRCPGCGRRTAAGELNWRQSGGCAHVFVDIWGIHTGEAVPGEQLLERLGAGWRFFYTED